MRPLALIVAMTPEGVIGADGKIPWRVSEDLKRFKALTTNHAIIMGRKTFESIGKPLPNRRNIAISRKPWSATLQGLCEPRLPITLGQLEWWRTFEAALNSAYATDSEPFVIGGGEIYQLAFPLATRLEVTYVIRDFETTVGAPITHFKFYGDGGHQTYPPLREWRCTNIERAKEHNDVEFHTFERRGI